MKIKRQFSLLLIFVAICATMTSCGDKQTSTSAEPSNQTEQSTSHKTSEQEEQIKSEIGLHMSIQAQALYGQVKKLKQHN